tara:strand:- start:1827 stop:2975 length:1149 start_codon:yes stop_codon:yes gene_type:complete
MKKILIIHTRYRESGGEDTAVLNEIDILNKSYEVKTLFFENKINNILMDIIALITSSNVSSKTKTKKIIESFSPDIIYVHNTWFKASISVLKLINNTDIPSYIKIHNYRYICANTFFASKHLNKNDYCVFCGFTKKRYQIFNKFYPDSYLKSLFLIFYGIQYRNHLKSTNSKLLVLTNFHKQLLIERINPKKEPSILKNCISEDLVAFQAKKINQIIYAGRISKEKGIEELIKSFLKVFDNNVKLKIIGEGPILNEMIGKFSQKNIEFTGYQNNSTVLKEISISLASIMATKLVEGQPMLLTECIKLGTPIIVPNIGGIKEFLPNDYELLYDYKNNKSLIEKLELIKNLTKRSEIEEILKRFYSDHLSQEKYLKRFSDIIQK